MSAKLDLDELARKARAADESDRSLSVVDDADLVTRGACTCVIAELYRQRESKKSHDGRRAERARRAIARLRRSP